MISDKQFNKQKYWLLNQIEEALGQALTPEVIDSRIIPELPDMFCTNHEGARSQRRNELARGLTTQGTKGFEIRGCYDCTGYNKDCSSYKPNNIDLMC